MGLLTFEEGRQLKQGRVGFVVEPTLDENAVVGLEREVLGHIVDDDCFVQRTADSTQVLDEHHVVRGGVLSVEAEGDAFVLVDGVEHPIRIVLHRRSENDDLVHLRHLLQELVAARPDPE